MLSTKYTGAEQKSWHNGSFLQTFGFNVRAQTCPRPRRHVVGTWGCPKCLWGFVSCAREVAIAPRTRIQNCRQIKVLVETFGFNVRAQMCPRPRRHVVGTWGSPKCLWGLVIYRIMDTSFSWNVTRKHKLHNSRAALVCKPWALPHSRRPRRLTHHSPNQNSWRPKLHSRTFFRLFFGSMSCHMFLESSCQGLFNGV